MTKSVIWVLCSMNRVVSIEFNTGLISSTRLFTFQDKCIWRYKNRSYSTITSNKNKKKEKRKNIKKDTTDVVTSITLFSELEIWLQKPEMYLKLQHVLHLFNVLQSLNQCRSKQHMLLWIKTIQICMCLLYNEHKILCEKVFSYTRKMNDIFLNALK